MQDLIWRLVDQSHEERCKVEKTDGSIIVVVGAW